MIGVESDSASYVDSCPPGAIYAAEHDRLGVEGPPGAAARHTITCRAARQSGEIRDTGHVFSIPPDTVRFGHGERLNAAPRFVVPHGAAVARRRTCHRDDLSGTVVDLD